MSLRVEVEHEGAVDEAVPVALVVGDRRVGVVAMLDRWPGEDHVYVKLLGEDGARYLVRYDRASARWELRVYERVPEGGAEIRT